MSRPEGDGARSRRIPIRPPATSQSASRVTTFELFFDLVYVFAFTQVSRLMAETHSAIGILQALIILSLMWWTWVGYSWISNQASADQPFLRTVMTLAMIAQLDAGVPAQTRLEQSGRGIPVVRDEAAAVASPAGAHETAITHALQRFAGGDDGDAETARQL